MYLLYLDESGVPERGPSQTSHYVLLGAAVYEGTWFALSRRLWELRSRYALGPPLDFEIHAKVLNRPYWEQGRIDGFESLPWEQRREQVHRIRDVYRRDDLPRLSTNKRRAASRYLRDTEPFVHLTLDERRAILREANVVLGSHRRGLVLFGEAIEKSCLPPAVDPVKQAFEQVITRFEAFLKRSGSDWGMILMDEDRSKSGKLQELMRTYQAAGSPWGSIDHVIEAPFFVDSRMNSAVQAVDAAAYALRRYVELREEPWFSLVFPKFDRADGKLHGLRHYVARGACDCMICQERGHSGASGA